MEAVTLAHPGIQLQSISRETDTILLDYTDFSIQCGEHSRQMHNVVSTYVTALVIQISSPHAGLNSVQENWK